MIKFIIVNDYHPICQNKPPSNINSKMIAFWHSRGIWKCKNAALAIVRDELVGFFRFSKEKQTLFACGTYVLSKYRKHNIAKTLWKMAIEKTKPKRIVVTATSFGAMKLFQSLKRKYKNIEFNIERDF